MKTIDLKVGDRVKIKNSITGTIMEITPNGWIKVVWTFVNNGRFIDMPATETMIDSFRARDVAEVIN